MGTPALPIFTIGHSNHSLEELLRLLTMHDITAVGDVRSMPYSRFTPHFNRDTLRASLKKHGIAYVHLGDQLGGRSDDMDCYEDGRIRYDRMARKSTFKAGIERLLSAAANWRIALLCAEKDPLHCHRTLLVANALAVQGQPVSHILADGRLEMHEDTMDRLLQTTNMQPDLFRQQADRAELVRAAIARQAGQVGYKLPEASARERR